MEISTRVVKRLEEFISKGPEQAEAIVLDSPQQKGYIVAVPNEEMEFGITVTFRDYDRYSVVLRTLEVSHNVASLNGSSEDYLHHCADQITQRLSYLEEPMALVELDEGAGLAQLRTEPIQQAEDTIIYWEALLRINPDPKVSLSRYRWTPDQRDREVLEYPATVGIIGRMAADLAASLAQEETR